MSAHLYRTFKRQLSSLMARLASRPALTPAELLALRPRRVLIVRQHNQMGDMVCATPVLRAIRETFPGAEILLVTAPVNEEVVLHNPHLDHVVTFDQKMWRRPSDFFRFVGRLRNYRADVAFVLSSVSFSVTSSAIALFSGARYVVGGDSAPFGWDISRHAFSLEMPSDPVQKIHAVEHNLAPLRAIGISTDDTSTVVVPAPEETAYARRILTDLGLLPGFWAIHPGAGKKQNVWPAERFAEVASRAVAAGEKILLLHGPADAGPLAELTGLLADEIGSGVKVAPACPVGVGAALLQQANRFLCNDTGVMHMAGALRVPTVTLFGPTDPALWKPPAPEVVVVRSGGRLPDRRGEEFGWMENIDVDSVWEAWKGLPGRPLIS
ncbi:MAG: glycosyltransferase family 9 protein [Candidatus Krumholzibacteria bacterium]|nr:glycosyltransferase family 9 protein [Candidatus Krumholzibacteria bacterium]